jgi:hypothetical protein
MFQRAKVFNIVIFIVTKFTLKIIYGLITNSSFFIYSVTSENRTPVGLAKKFGIWKFPEFRSSGLSEQVETLNISCFSETGSKIYEADLINKIKELLDF